MEKSRTASGKRKRKPGASAEDLSEAPIAVVEVLLNVYLWPQHGGETPQSALAMVGDLLSASSCEVRDGSPSSLAASFLDTVQAINAARRIAQLVQGFSRGSKSGPLAGCFILSAADDADHDAEMKQRQTALARGHSGQVLFVGSLCESARSIPGLRFEAVAGELETDRLYRQVLQLLPPAGVEGYVAPPIERPAPVNIQPPIAATGKLAASPIATRQPPIGDAFSPPPALEAASTPDQKIAGFSRVEKSDGRGLALRWVAIGGAAVVVLAAVALRVSGSRTSQHPAASPPPLVQPPLSTPAVNTAVPPPPSQQPKVGATVPSRPPDPRDTATAKRKPAAAAHDQPKTAEQDAKPDATGKTGISFSPDEINRMIDYAEKESGDGKFDDAISTYGIVLKHDPSNARAKEGLARATRNRDHQ